MENKNIIPQVENHLNKLKKPLTAFKKYRYFTAFRKSRYLTAWKKWRYPLFYRLQKFHLFLVIPFFMGEKTAKITVNFSTLKAPPGKPYKFKGINIKPLILNVILWPLVKPFLVVFFTFFIMR
jgi:hypothetical protein